MEVGHAFQEGPLPRLFSEFNLARAGREPMPWLAALVCCSAFDIALHDAYGNASRRPDLRDLQPAVHEPRPLGISSSRREESNVSFEGKYPRISSSCPGPTRLPAWHLVGGKDLLDASELTGTEPEDGYPVLLRDWIRRDGLKCLKVKLRGNDAGLGLRPPA